MVTSSQLIVTLVATVAAWLVTARIIPSRLRRLAAGGRLPCENVFGYSPAFIYGEFDRYGPEGRARYRTFLLADCIFAPIYATFLAVAVAYFTDVWFAATPLLVAADWTENSLLGIAVSRYPDRQQRVVALASWATRTKFALLLLTVGFVVIRSLTQRRAA